MRIQGCHQYGSIPLLPYWGMTLPRLWNSLRQWVHFEGVHSILDLLSWDQEELKAIPAQQVYSHDDNGQGLFLRTNQIKQMCALITYMKHIFGSYNSGIALRMIHFSPSHLMNGPNKLQQ